MIPDYLTFIRFQDKRNLIYIYAIGLILIGFYWKNAGFTFPSEDIGVVSGILALVLYNFIFDLKAYWAYKCVTKNIDFSWFKKKQNHKIELFLTQPLVAGFLSLIMLSAMSWGLYQLLPSLYALVPDFVTWAVGHLSAVSDDPHQLCQAGRYFSSEKSKI